MDRKRLRKFGKAEPYAPDHVGHMTIDVPYNHLWCVTCDKCITCGNESGPSHQGQPGYGN